MTEKENKRLRPQDFPTDPKTERLTRPKRAPLRRILGLALILLVVLGTVLLASYWDLNSFDSVRRLLSYNKTEQDEQGRIALYHYAAGTDTQHVLLGDTLLSLSGSRAALVDRNGTELYACTVNFGHPAIARGGKTAAVYDVGGTTLTLLNEKGLLRSMDGACESGVISVTLNESDYMAVTAEKSGCKAAVSVYDPAGGLLFTFNSSEHYLSDACVLSDNSHVAVVLLEEKDGAFASCVQVYALDQETAIGGHTAEALALTGQNVGPRLLTVWEDRLTAANEEGELIGTYPFYYPYLRGYTFGDDFAALLLSRYRSGSTLRLVTLDGDGGVLAQTDLQNEVLDISAQGKYLAVLYADRLTVYRSDLTEYASFTNTEYVTQVEMREDGTVLLMGSGTAWLFVP